MKTLIRMSLALFVLSIAAFSQPPTPWQAGDIHLALPPDSLTLSGATRHVNQAAYGFFEYNGAPAIYGVTAFDKVGICSGRGCRPPVTHYYESCAWDLDGTVLGCIPGLVPQPLPIAIVNTNIPPPGYGVTQIITFATNGVVDIGANKAYGNTTYDFTGFIHPTSAPAQAP